MLGRVEGLARRIDLRESGAFERLEQEPQRRLLALGQGRGVGGRGGFQRERQRVGDRQEVRGEALDTVLPGRIDLARGALADVFEFGDRAQEIGAVLLGPALRLRQPGFSGSRPVGGAPFSGSLVGPLGSISLMRVGCGAQSREFKAEPSIRAAISTTGITRS